MSGPFSERLALPRHIANRELIAKLGQRLVCASRLAACCKAAMLARQRVIRFLRQRGKKEPAAVGDDALMAAPTYPGLPRRSASFFPVGLLVDFFCPAASIAWKRTGT